VGEGEARLAAVEGLLMELLALEAPGRLEQLRVAVRTWSDGEQRDQALQWLEAAGGRFDEFEVGRALVR
jgi:hypothetical protein